MRKKILLLVISFLGLNNLYSQNSIDPPRLPDTVQFNPTTIHVVNFNNPTIFRKNTSDFQICWNYGEDGRQLDKLMSINGYLTHWESGMNVNWSRYGDSINWFLRIRPFGSNTDENINTVEAMYYEPAITVDTTDNFTPGVNNLNGAIYGFLNKDQNLSISNNCVVTNSNCSTTLPILSNIWPNDELRFWYNLENSTVDSTWIDSLGITRKKDIGYEEGHYGRGDQRNKYNCKEMYLSINLKATDSILTNNLDSALIRIKIKINAKHDSLKTIYATTIKFDSITNGGLQDINSSLLDYRGKTRTLQALFTPTREFIITPRMLITNSQNSTSDEYITLSAKFNCWYNPDDNIFDSTNVFNPYLKTKNGSTFDGMINHDYFWFIDNMDIEVYYSSSSGYNAEIQWIKIVTPGAKELFEGQHDWYYHKKVWQAQQLFNTTVTNAGHRLAGFYGNCEYDKSQIAASRYFNILLDTMSNSEMDLVRQIPSQQQFGTAYKTFWNGANLSSSISSAAPFIQQGSRTNNKLTSGFMNGYAGNIEDNLFSIEEIKKSKYETWLRTEGGDRNSFINDTLELYDLPYSTSTNTRYIFSYGKQFAYEQKIYTSYFKRKSLLFGQNPWIAWMWINSAPWVYDTTWQGVYNNGNRPLTGEELSLQLLHPIAMGAKGQYFWLKTKPYQQTFENSQSLEICLLPSTSSSFQDTVNNRFPDNLPADSAALAQLLTHTMMYGDFIDFSLNSTQDSLYQFGRFANHPEKYDWSAMNLQEYDRVYIGLNSIRTGLKKHTDWITKNNALLMSLKLMAWRGKGFSTMYQQADGLTSNYINKFIDVSQIKTRPLGLEKNGLPYYEQDMQQDSSFYDIMIHRIGETSLDDSLVIAVVNRRTDPLIYDEEDEEFYFISTHEFDNLTLDTVGNQKRNPISNEMKSTDYWREKYWQRQGIREIRIKMKYEKPGTHDKVLLRVQELLAENEPLTNMNGTPGSTPEWWRQERWNNAVKDTVIRSDGELVLKLLPGSGRMFKVTVEETQDIVGELANSNQTKIIAYPARQTSNQDYSGHDDSVYYHMVYHKKNPQTNKYNVYYTRSQHAYLHNTNTKTIQWRPEQRLANVLHVSQDIEPQLLGDGLGIADTTCDCKYPTLTARYDTDNQIAKIYVVFNCEGWSIPDTPKVFIFERSFPIDAPNVEPTTQLDPIGYAYASSQLNGLMIDRWGLSSVNGSLSGNYFAWNDSLLGIKAGFKRPENSGYITNLISFKFNDNTNYNALFPSMNTFSMIPYYDDNAGLAWQETTNEFLPNASSKIYYTMLRIDQNYDIYNYVPQNTCDPGQPLFNDYIYSNDFKIACISPFPLITNYKFPQVYRNAESVFNDSNQVLAKGAGDRVYWQGTQDGLPFSSIYIKMIDLYLGADCFNCLYPKRVFDTAYHLGYVNAGPGDLLITGNPDDFNWSDSSYIFNFVRYQNGINQPDYNSNLYSITHNYWGVFQDNGLWSDLPHSYNNIGSSLIITGKGKYPHSVASSVIKKAGDWKLNNLIFESYNPSIKTNYSPFLKEGTEQLFTYPIVKFVNKKSNKEFTLSHIELRNEFSPDKNKIDIKMFKRENGIQSYLDTVQTDWIKLAELNELSFLVDGLKLETVQIKLQRKQDKRTYDLNTKSKIEKKINLNKFHLLNGKNEEYRLIILRADSTIVSNDLLISPEIDFQYIDTLSSKQLGKSTSINEQIIDLANNSSYSSTEEFELIAYPNPATDIIYASALLPLEIIKENTNIELTYILANSIGTEIERTTASSGEIVNFKTHNLSSGAYFIKVEANTNILNPLSKSKSIIIIR